MSMEYSSGFCRDCNANRKLERKSTNHILHLLITVILGLFTFGVGALVWIVIWILLSIQVGGWMCSTCGSKRVGKKSEIVKSISIICIVLFFIFFISILNNTSEDEVKSAIHIKKKSNNISIENTTFIDKSLKDVDKHKKFMATISNYYDIKKYIWQNQHLHVLTIFLDSIDEDVEMINLDICKRLNQPEYKGIFGDFFGVNIVLKDYDSKDKISDYQCDKK